MDAKTAAGAGSFGITGEATKFQPCRSEMDAAVESGATAPGLRATASIGEYAETMISNRVNLNTSFVLRMMILSWPHAMLYDGLVGDCSL
jgi:hypothetical protein